MGRPCEQRLGLGQFHDGAQIHDRDPVRDVAHQAQIVGDEQHRQMQPALEFQEQIDDLGLDGDVEG